jgi:hypothetical protein
MSPLITMASKELTPFYTQLALYESVMSAQRDIVLLWLAYFLTDRQIC